MSWLNNKLAVPTSTFCLNDTISEKGLLSPVVVDKVLELGLFTALLIASSFANTASVIVI